MKHFLHLLYISIFLASCQQDKPDENSVTSRTEKGYTSEETGDIYAQDWETFKNAVITRDKETVLFFAEKNQESLRDILDLSYDYIFDDVMIENIQNLNYSDLPNYISDTTWKELNIIYFGEIDGEIYESGTFLYFEERPEGLRIVNFIAAG